MTCISRITARTNHRGPFSDKAKRKGVTGVGRRSQCGKHGENEMVPWVDDRRLGDPRRLENGCRTKNIVRCFSGSCRFIKLMVVLYSLRSLCAR